MNHLKTHQTNPTTAQYRPVQSNTSTAQYSQVQPIPEPDPKPELFGQTRPEPDPKSKSPTRQTLVDETDHDQMLASVKSIEMDGLLWGAHKLIPIGYGIKKLQVMCTVEDEKVSVEELTEKIEEFEDFVQSCDVNAMNKI